MYFADRSTAIGKTIDSYLQGKSEIDDHAIHLMFSANRWEMRYSNYVLSKLRPRLQCLARIFPNDVFTFWSYCLANTNNDKGGLVKNTMRLLNCQIITTLVWNLKVTHKNFKILN